MQAMADMLKTEGYATDPIYAKSLKRLLGEYADIRRASSCYTPASPNLLDWIKVILSSSLCVVLDLVVKKKQENEGGRTPEAGSGNVVGVSHPDTGSGYGIQGTERSDGSGPLAFSRL